jgi:predicted Ser/Thr protein kinase
MRPPPAPPSKKSAQQAARSQQKLLREARKKHRRVKPETLEASGYFVVQTTLMDEPASTIMELYRHR